MRRRTFSSTAGAVCSASLSVTAAACVAAVCAAAACAAAPIIDASTVPASVAPVTAMNVAPAPAYTEDGYDLWLRYRPISDARLLDEYRAAITHLVSPGDSPTLVAARDELTRALPRLLDRNLAVAHHVERDGALIVGTPTGSPLIAALSLDNELSKAGEEGFVLRNVTVNGRRAIAIAANSDIGVLYGTFALLRHLQTHESLRDLSILGTPRIRHRLLNHWDNLNRTVERGYAGFSLWDWHKLPDYIDPRYRDYARANASLGINGVAITNVNANAMILQPHYLAKVAALADVFRPYGVRVFLTARFNAPVEIGGLRTGDPADPAVQAWWRAKAEEIYSYVPDFGGFLVKANSEGQPGPQDYGRTHAEGANMLADAVAPHGGIVMWRAFVYSNEVPVDRIRQAYDEFEPLDGRFRENVVVQVKNGPLDFQPREPFHPLFGAMPRTPLMMEFQITKEYLGFATHLAYLGPLFKEVLDADTYARGPGSTVGRVIDGTLHGHGLTAIAGVANTGTDRNWTGGHFAQANWYVFGRLAWDHTLSDADIADEWIRMTFTTDANAVTSIRGMMMDSREHVVNYMTPLGLHHLMARSHHYGPGPWVTDAPRADWTSVYFHRADTVAIGFDRTATGSNAVAQYFQPVRDRFARRATVPDELLLFFHRVRWDEPMRSGRSLWDELVHRYHAGVEGVRALAGTWDALEAHIDAERFAEVQAYLRIQEKEAVWWRDASIAYFQTFSRMPIPAGYEPPAHPLEYYLSLSIPFVPGI